MIKNKLTNILSLLLIIFVVGYYGKFIIMANADLSQGRYALYMDEHITFDGVKNILHPHGVNKFIENVIDGGDHRYGRILWNVSAVASFIPELIFKAKGQIIATRMVLALALIAAYLILVFGQIRNWFLRFILFLFLMSMPTTSYYMTMPKPEPLQLLFLSLFLLCARKEKFNFGRYWIFLGLAFGAKISVLFLIPFFMIIGFWLYYRNDSYFRNNIKQAFIYLGLGFLISEPIFLMIIKRFSLKFIKVYLKWTFLSTGHGSDDSAVTWMDWFKHLVNINYSNIPLFFTKITCWLVFILVVSGLVVIFRSWMGKNKLADSNCNELGASYVLFFSGLILIIPVMFLVKRVWPNYLNNGFAVFFVAVFSIGESFYVCKKSRLRFLGLLVFYLTVLLLIIEALFFLVPLSSREYLKFANRSKDQNFIEKKEEIDAISVFLEDASKKLGRTLQVYYDSNILLLDSNKYYNIIPIYGPFFHWDEGKDMVVSYKKSIEGPLPAKTSALYEDLVKVHDSLSQHVTEIGNTCSLGTCYVIYPFSLEKLRIYVRADLLDKIKN